MANGRATGKLAAWIFIGVMGILFVWGASKGRERERRNYGSFEVVKARIDAGDYPSEGNLFQVMGRPDLILTDESTVGGLSRRKQGQRDLLWSIGTVEGKPHYEVVRVDADGKARSAILAEIIQKQP